MVENAEDASLLHERVLTQLLRKLFLKKFWIN
jgi:hypothetical protein